MFMYKEEKVSIHYFSYMKLIAAVMKTPVV